MRLCFHSPQNLKLAAIPGPTFIIAPTDSQQVITVPELEALAPGPCTLPALSLGIGSDGGGDRGIDRER